MTEIRVELLTAATDQRLRAQVIARRPLLYDAGADPLSDRPAHVRSGSGAVFWGERLWVIQDDANFLASIDTTTSRVDFMELPRGRDGARQFDDLRGNKSHKLDLECCTVLDVDGAETFVAFGSGSTAARESVLVLHAAGGPRLVHAPALYAALRARRDFSRGALNVEGVVVSGDRLVFVQRGSGVPDAADRHVSAFGMVSLSAVTSLLAGRDVNGFDVLDVVRFDLGEIGGVRLTFTDAAAASPSGVLYLAAAEASPDAVADGPVAGSAIGVYRDGCARQTPLLDRNGALLVEKAEGIAVRPGDPLRAFVVLDPDDADRPSELCEVRLSGPW